MKTKLENLIVINKEEIEKELVNLKAIKDNGYIYTGLKHDKEYIDIKIYCLEQIIANSKPLKPFTEDALKEACRIPRMFTKNDNIDIEIDGCRKNCAEEHDECCKIWKINWEKYDEALNSCYESLRNLKKEYLNKEIEW